MAYARRRPKTQKKATRRYRRKTRANYSIARTTPISDRYFARLNYSSLHALTYTGAGATSPFQMYLNGMFDPQVSIGGHQPMGFDQLMVLYNKYRVYGCKWSVTFVSQDTTQHAEVLVRVRPNTTTQTIYQDLCESAYTQKRVLGTEGSGQAVQVIKGYTSIAKIRGVAKQTVRAEDTYSGSATANPSTQPCLNIHVSNMNTASAITVNVRIQMQFFAEFFDRKILTGS